MTHDKRGPVVALLFFAAITVIWFSPVLRNFTTHVAGAGGDPFQTLWRFVRLESVIREGSLAIPEEQAVRNFGPLPWMPFRLLFGEVVAYNTAWLWSAILSGWCTFLLARAWGARAAPALLAGLLVEFSPYRLSQALGHFGAMQIWWIPATLAALTWWVRTRSWRWAVASGLLLVGAAWTEHQLFVALAVAVAVVGGFAWQTVLRHVRHSARAVALVAVIVGGGAVLPFMGTLQTTASPWSNFNLGQTQRERFSATAASLFTPSPFHLMRERLRGYGGDTSTAADHVHTIGVLLPLVVLAGLRRPWDRKTRALVALAIIGLVLSLGPEARLGSVSLPLPGALIDRLPVLSALRTLGRFVVLTVVALPLLVVLRPPFTRLRPEASAFAGASADRPGVSPGRKGEAGASAGLSREAPRGAKSDVAGLLGATGVSPWGSTLSRPLLRLGLGALLVAEILPAWGFPRLAVSQELATALADVPPGALLVVPTATNYRLASEHLYLSAFHGHPLVGNSALERAMDPDVGRLARATPVVGDLVLLRLDSFTKATFFGQTLPDVAPAAFSSHGVRAVLFDADPLGGVVRLTTGGREVLGEGEKDVVRRFLRETLKLEEEEALQDHVFLYRVPEPGPTATPLVALRGGGWTLIERAPTVLSTELSKVSELRLFALRTTEAVLFCGRVRERGATRSLAVERPGGITREVDIPAAGLLEILLGNIGPGWTTVTFRLDEPGLRLENPRIRFGTTACASSS